MTRGVLRKTLDYFMLASVRMLGSKQLFGKAPVEFIKLEKNCNEVKREQETKLKTAVLGLLKPLGEPWASQGGGSWAPLDFEI